MPRGVCRGYDACGIEPSTRPRSSLLRPRRGHSIGTTVAAIARRRMAGVRSLDAERRRLVEKHIRLAEKIARNHYKWGSEDPDETRSDAFWGLTLAGVGFRPDRGSFTSYAALRIEYAIRRGRQVRSGILARRGSGATALRPYLSTRQFETAAPNSSTCCGVNQSPRRTG